MRDAVPSWLRWQTIPLVTAGVLAALVGPASVMPQARGVILATAGIGVLARAIIAWSHRVSPVSADDNRSMAYVALRAENRSFAGLLFRAGFPLLALVFGVAVPGAHLLSGTRDPLLGCTNLVVSGLLFVSLLVMVIGLGHTAAHIALPIPRWLCRHVSIWLVDQSWSSWRIEDILGCLRREPAIWVRSACLRRLHQMAERMSADDLVLWMTGEHATLQQVAATELAHRAPASARQEAIIRPLVASS